MIKVYIFCFVGVNFWKKSHIAEYLHLLSKYSSFTVRYF